MVVPDLAGLAAGDVEREIEPLACASRSAAAAGCSTACSPAIPSSASRSPPPARDCAAGRPFAWWSPEAASGSSSRRHRDEPDARLTTVAQDAEHDPALDRRAARARDAVPRARATGPPPAGLEVVQPAGPVRWPGTGARTPSRRRHAREPRPLAGRAARPWSAAGPAPGCPPSRRPWRKPLPHCGPRRRRALRSDRRRLLRCSRRSARHPSRGPPPPRRSPPRGGRAERAGAAARSLAAASPPWPAH